MILRPVVVWLLPRTLVEPRDLREEELLDELGLETLSVALGLFSFLFAVILTACITGRLGASLSRPLPFAALDPRDVGREGVDALDAFFALGTVFGVITEVGLALSSSVELSIDCIATFPQQWILQLPVLQLHRQRSMSYLDSTQNSSLMW